MASPKPEPVAPAPPPASIHRTVLREEVKAVLLQRILSGHYAPGDRLVEIRIAGQGVANENRSLIDAGGDKRCGEAAVSVAGLSITDCVQRHERTRRHDNAQADATAAIPRTGMNCPAE